jgi:GDPmannose 4,6-dehydratase
MKGRLRAIVLGVNGQDGSLLAESLLAQRYVVCGIGRQPTSRYVAAQEGYSYVSCDMTDPQALNQVLHHQKPEFVFHVAAVHGSAGFQYESVALETMMVNLVSVQVVLEYLRRHRPDGFLLYASSAKVFAAPLPEVVDEAALKATTCLYSYTKNSAADLISFYRRRHGIGASILYLFQHESPRRAAAYFIPKICSILLEALHTPSAKGQVGTLDFYCDWGAAQEYMELAVAISAARLSEDFVVASGVTWHARQFVETLFAAYGLDWAAFIEEIGAGPNTQPFFQVSTAKLQNRLGRTPQRTILEVCDEILQSKRPPQ